MFGLVLFLLEGEFTLAECDINKLARFEEHKV